MATIAVGKPIAAGTISGNSPAVRLVKAAASATINGGDLLVGSGANVLDTVAVSATPATTTKDKAGFAIHGVKDGTAWYLNDAAPGGTQPEGGFGGTFGGTFMDSSKLLRSIEGIGTHVLLADPDNVFEITLAGTFALNQVGLPAGITQDATTKFWQADTAQANKVCTVIGFPGGPNKGVVADITVRVWIRFLNSVYILGF